MQTFKRVTTGLLIVLFINLSFVPLVISATAPDIQYVKVKGTTVSNNGSITLPGGHPKSPTCGHFKIPHLKR